MGEINEEGDWEKLKIAIAIYVISFFPPMLFAHVLLVTVLIHFFGQGAMFLDIPIGIGVAYLMLWVMEKGSK